MMYRIHIQVADASRLYHDTREMLHIPSPGDKYWVDAEGFSGEVVINRDPEVGHRKTYGDITEIHLCAHPLRYDD